MEDIAKTIDIKFKLWTVKKRNYEAMLDCGKEREYTGRIKDISKHFRGNIRSVDQGYRA